MPATPINTPSMPTTSINNNTPPINYDDTNIHGFTPPSNSSQYSSDYNDEWDAFMNNPNVTRRRARASSIPHDDEDDFIQGRGLSMNDLDGESSSNDEFDNLGLGNTDSQEELSNPKKDEIKNWGEGVIPPTPDYPKQIIDINANGYDPTMMEDVKVEDYLKEDKKDNIAILYNGKTYLTSRSIIEQQENDAIIYECLEGGMKTKEKLYSNVIGNLPLYNIKKIGIDISSDNAAGIEPEYIYMNGIDELLEDNDNWQYYSIIPLLDKQLVSVISLSEAAKLGSDFSGVSALHCQAGQGGLAGIMVKAYPSTTSGGKKRYHNTKTMKHTGGAGSGGKRKGKGKRKRKTLKKKMNNQIGCGIKRKTIRRNKKSISKSHSKKH